MCHVGPLLHVVCWLIGCSLIQILKDLPLLPWAAGKNALSKVKDTDLALILLLQTLEKKIEGKS